VTWQTARNHFQLVRPVMASVGDEEVAQWTVKLD